MTARLKIPRNATWKYMLIRQVCCSRQVTLQLEDPHHFEHRAYPHIPMIPY